MNLTIDTNVLVRALVAHPTNTDSDARQSEAAQALMREASTIVVSTVMLCEAVWVMRQRYGAALQVIHDAISRLCEAANVVCNMQEVAAGLAQMRVNADFADGVIAHQGVALGADIFFSFDRKAVRRLREAGHDARLVGQAKQPP